MKNILEMKNITKRFPGVKALSDVNFEIEQGEIHAVVGENGAGKSTLMNILSGMYPFGSYEGEVIYNGEVCKFTNIKDSEHKGIVIIHQELALVPFMTIAENMFLGNECGSALRIDWDETFQKCANSLKKVNLDENPHTLVKDIGVGKQQLVEIAKALTKNARLLILDEPTASLNEEDAQNLLDLMSKLRDNGITLIIISHKLNEIRRISDRITIIRDGAVIETLINDKVTIDEARIVKGMVGRSITDQFPKRVPQIGEVAIEVKNWTVYHPLWMGQKVCDNVNFYARKGEVVGISGLIGAGRTELAMSIFGMSYGADISGELYINNQKTHLKSVKDAIRAKMAYVTEDRKGDGLVLSNPIRSNITLANMERTGSAGFIIDKDAEIAFAREYSQSFGVKSSGIEQHVGNLSGGNQQKVLLAKWMFTEPDILILDEPTRGIDVVAKHEIYNIINRLVAQGKAVVMISSEMPELLGMCDRIYVMNEGRIIGELSKEEASQEVIMTMILKETKERKAHG